MADDSPRSAAPRVDAATQAPLTAAALAQRADFPLGLGKVHPSLRTVDGPAGSVTTEPRVMQVLVVLADAAGAVVSRDELIRLCWDGRVVSDDSVNRAVAEARRVARDTGAAFTIETIARIGYRLVSSADIATAAVETTRPGVAPAEGRRLIGRRWLLAAVAATGAAAASTTVWWLSRRRTDALVRPQIDAAELELRTAMPGAGRRAAAILDRALVVAPDNNTLWGLMALAQSDIVRNGSAEESTSALLSCERAARRALAINAREGNALASLALVQPFVGDWAATEDRLRSVLKIAPDTIAAMNELVLLLQATGRCTDSLHLNDRVAELDPLSPLPQYRRALKHWIFNRLPAADLVIDRALQLWPQHPAVWNARMVIFAFTGRPRAALSFLEQPITQPKGITATTIHYWRTTLAALDSRTPAAVAAAREECFRSVPLGPSMAVWSTMVFSVLGDLDSAYTVANGYLLREGPLVGSIMTTRQDMPINDMRRRETMNLFVPATTAMRLDPRFAHVCDGIGLTRYWKQRGIGPDAFLMKA